MQKSVQKVKTFLKSRLKWLDESICDLEVVEFCSCLIVYNFAPTFIFFTALEFIRNFVWSKIVRSCMPQPWELYLRRMYLCWGMGWKQMRKPKYQSSNSNRYTITYLHCKTQYLFHCLRPQIFQAKIRVHGDLQTSLLLPGRANTLRSSK